MAPGHDIPAPPRSAGVPRQAIARNPVVATAGSSSSKVSQRCLGAASVGSTVVNRTIPSHRGSTSRPFLPGNACRPVGSEHMPQCNPPTGSANTADATTGLSAYPNIRWPPLTWMTGRNSFVRSGVTSGWVSMSRMVSMKPGETSLTVMPYWPSPEARDLVRVRRPPLPTEWGTRVHRPASRPPR
jgi:hypothetical protein